MEFVWLIGRERTEGCVLLECLMHLQRSLFYAEPVLQDPSYAPLIQDQAMRITNITISDFPAALKVFSTHGLYYGMSSLLLNTPNSFLYMKKADTT